MLKSPLLNVEKCCKFIRYCKLCEYISQRLESNELSELLQGRLGDASLQFYSSFIKRSKDSCRGFRVVQDIL